MRRLLALFLAAVAALLATPEAGAVARPATNFATYTYDSPRCSVPGSQDISERGPPRSAYIYATHHAVDHWSRGASTRLDGRTTRDGITYEDSARFVQVARPATTTSGDAAEIGEDLCAIQRRQVAAKSGDALLSTGASGAGRRLPMNMQTVCETACKYDIDISDVTIKINKGRAGYAGSTGPDGTITLTRSAFTNEEQLARTLFHERFHVDQIRGGMGYPTSRAAAGPWEDAAVAAESSWWASR